MNTPLPILKFQMNKKFLLSKHFSYASILKIEFLVDPHTIKTNIIVYHSSPNFTVPKLCSQN